MSNPLRLGCAKDCTSARCLGILCYVLLGEKLKGAVEHRNKMLTIWGVMGTFMISCQDAPRMRWIIWSGILFELERGLFHLK